MKADQRAYRGRATVGVVTSACEGAAVVAVVAIVTHTGAAFDAFTGAAFDVRGVRRRRGGGIGFGSFSWGQMTTFARPFLG